MACLFSSYKTVLLCLLSMLLVIIFSKCADSFSDCVVCDKESSRQYISSTQYIVYYESTLACSQEAVESLRGKGWSCPDYTIDNANYSEDDVVSSESFGWVNMIYPEDGTIGVPLDTLLVWSPTGFSSEVTFDVFLDLEENKYSINMISEGQKDTTYSVSLSPSTEYVWNIRANSLGKSWSTPKNFFTTKPKVIKGGTFLDSRNGKVYKTVTIDDMTWMAENLAYEVPGKNVVSDEAWHDWSDSTSIDGWCYYNNDKDSLGKIYGILYKNLTAKEACPEGWHIATKDEWYYLRNAVGSEGAGKFKESGTIHWPSPNSESDDELGISAIPGGYRSPGGAFIGLGYKSKWRADPGHCFELDTSNVIPYQCVLSSMIDAGLYVRCVKD